MPYKAIMERLAEKTRENNVINDSDYTKNGLLYCGKCNTPKQKEINFMGSIKKPYCMCSCETEKHLKEKALLANNMNYMEIRRLRDEAFPTHQHYSDSKEDMRTWTFANQNGSNPKIMLVAERYAENFDKCFKEGLGFLFYGNVGAGKSYAAASIVNAVVEKKYPALMTTFGRIRGEVSDVKLKNAYFDKLNSYALLVVDDLFAESDGEYMKEITFQVIDERITNKMPLIITTNLTEEELKSPANIKHQRILSRIKKVCRPLLFDGSDQRVKDAFETKSLMKEILGI
ncbi:MAG: hypothetical protein K2I80_07370 [Ruminococcus sp.]|nr:hypothetical protein [Ruminococcus sp.]